MKNKNVGEIYIAYPHGTLTIGYSDKKTLIADYGELHEAFNMEKKNWMSDGAQTSIRMKDVLYISYTLSEDD